jgi:hypothetical protein
VLRVACKKGSTFACARHHQCGSKAICQHRNCCIRAFQRRPASTEGAAQPFCRGSRAYSSSKRIQPHRSMLPVERRCRRRVLPRLNLPPKDRHLQVQVEAQRRRCEEGRFERILLGVQQEAYCLGCIKGSSEEAKKALEKKFPAGSKWLLSKVVFDAQTTPAYITFGIQGWPPQVPNGSARRGCPGATCHTVCRIIYPTPGFTTNRCRDFHNYFCADNRPHRRVRECIRSARHTIRQTRGYR